MSAGPDLRYAMIGYNLWVLIFSWWCPCFLFVQGGHSSLVGLLGRNLCSPVWSQFGASLLVACSPRKDELICVVNTTPFLHKNKFQGVSDFFLVSPHHSVTACVRIIPNTAHWNLKKMWQYHDNVVLCVCNRP